MSESSGARPPILRHPLAMLLIGLTAGMATAYGVGLWQRSRALAEQAGLHAAVVAAKDAELSKAAEALATEKLATQAEASRAALLRARLGLYQALNDLDQRNFGLATDRLREVAARFDAVDAAVLGLDPAVLSSLREDIAGTQVLVATDFEQQRLRLLELAARIEPLVEARPSP